MTRPWPILTARPNAPDEVVLQYSTGTGFGSWAIRYRSGSRYSHADVVKQDGTLIGARSACEVGRNGQLWGSGVQGRCPDYSHFTHALRVRIKTPRAGDFYQWIGQQIGKPYDKKAILGFVFGRQMERDWRDPRAWFCDEMVVAGFERIGFWPRPLCLPYDRIDPGGSLLAFSAGPSYEELESF